MLLIAQPKSASTSLMWTLAHILKIAHKNGQNRRKGDKPCEEFQELQKYHGTMVKRNYNFLYDYICKPKVLYKEHILPTKRHLEIIDDVKKPVIVLIRNEDNTIESYKRVYSVLPEIKPDYEMLKSELLKFQNIYLEKESFHPDIYKVISFEQLMDNFTETIKKCIIHYNKEVPEDIEKYKLCKRNYTYR